MGSSGRQSGGVSLVGTPARPVDAVAPRPWLELLTEAATVVVVPLDDEAARDAGLLAALSGHPDTHSAACHAALVGIRRGWPVVTARPEVIQALSGEVRTETIP